MTLIVREAMQALLDGKTIRIRNTWGTPYLKKLDGDGNLIQFCENGSRKEWFRADDFYQAEIFEEVEEFPLDFKGALRAMLDGKVVTSELYPDFKLRFNEGIIEHFNKFLPGRGWRISRTFDRDEQESKWKVVE